MTPGDVGLRSYFQRMEMCQKPLPTDPKELINELGLRVLSVLPFHQLLEIRSADGVLEVTLDEATASSFKVLENNTPVFEFGVDGEPSKGWSRVLKGKDEIVIKALKIVMCRAFSGKRGLHLYHPPYPEPEILTVEEVEGQDYPRRFVRQEWLHWMADCHNRNPLILNVAMRVVSKRIFPGGSEGKTFKTKGTVPEKGLEFEILEVKRV